ncbi:MAG TPA: hypothetical protein VHB48_07955 [Chitinophagaceae bacterium]|nr:hypothetical protein [Chitinophagaceae bacterium]
MVQSSFAVSKRSSLFKTVLQAGLVAGTIDALFAVADFLITARANPVIIFWYIASGAFGSASSPKILINANIITQTLYAIAGVAFHYFIAFAFICILILVFPLLKKWLHSFVIIAVLYGIFAWLVMNYIVLPLAFDGKMPLYTLKTMLSVSYLIIAIGFTGSLYAARFYKKAKPKINR